MTAASQVDGVQQLAACRVDLRHKSVTAFRFTGGGRNGGRRREIHRMCHARDIGVSLVVGGDPIAGISRQGYRASQIAPVSKFAVPVKTGQQSVVSPGL